MIIIIVIIKCHRQNQLTYLFSLGSFFKLLLFVIVLLFLLQVFKLLFCLGSFVLVGRGEMRGVGREGAWERGEGGYIYTYRIPTEAHNTLPFQSHLQRHPVVP